MFLLKAFCQKRNHNARKVIQDANLLEDKNHEVGQHVHTSEKIKPEKTMRLYLNQKKN